MTTLRRFESLVLFRAPRTEFLQCRWTIKGMPRTQRSTKESRVEPAWTEALRRYNEAKLRAKGHEPEPTMGQLATLWVDAHYKLLSESHVDAVSRIGRKHLYGLEGRMISGVTTAMVEDARLAYLATHAKASANHWLAVIHSLYGWAIRRGMIRFVPWSVRQLRVQKKPKVLLPTDKAAPWLAAVDALTQKEPSIALAIRIMMGFGLRCESEAVSARWEWLDLERGTYTPGETKGKEAWARPVPDWIIEILRPIAQSWGLIVPTTSGRLLTSDRIQRVMDQACLYVSVSRLTPHCLRHTYATLLAEAGVPIQDIQRALGHKDIRTTLNYLGVSLERIARGQTRIAKTLRLVRRDFGRQPHADPGGENE